MLSACLSVEGRKEGEELFALLEDRPTLWKLHPAVHSERPPPQNKVSCVLPHE